MPWYAGASEETSMTSPQTASWTNGEHAGTTVGRGTEARRALREAGHRVTEQRLRVYEALQTAARPVSHPEMVALLPQDGMDRTTVYRILMDLTERGLAHRRDLGDHVWRFDLRGTDSRRHEQNHPHFSCTECGALECLPVDAVTLSPALAARSAAEIHVRGRCPRCAS
jgi:Fur family ferric uptake transcriptional regulator